MDVPFESLDGLFEKLDSVDLLFVDAEGNDADVLFGGEQTLKKTRYLEFEVNGNKGKWSSTKLKTVIEFLDNLEFDCFWMQGRTGNLFQITRCWTEKYEQGLRLGNVACAKRGDVWHSVLSIWRVMQMKKTAASN